VVVKVENPPMSADADDISRQHNGAVVLLLGPDPGDVWLASNGDVFGRPG
jgi:hypothetical protein